MKSQTFDQIEVLGLSLIEKLSTANQIISPSDFGFHNALRLNNDQLKFVDFEYAGWDDPAKLVGDFFNQVEVPVDRSYLSIFTESIAKMIDNSAQFHASVKLLLPLYRIKWTCIVLNYFVPRNQHEKNFVTSITSEKRYEQLQKAKKIVDTLIY